MKFLKNKKGFVYLISSLILIMILLVVFYSMEDYGFKDKQTLYQRRIIVMDDFVKAFNQDFERAMTISSFRTMIALEDYVATKGQYLNDTNNLLKETVYNGTIYGTQAKLMINSSIKDYIASSNKIASELGLRLDANVTSVSLSQTDPWHITVLMDVDLTLNDTSGLAYWKYNKTYQTKVPIYNLRDPLYSVSTQNRISNSIRILNITEFVGPGNDVTNLIEHINSSYYIASNKSPTFLMRFENNNSPNENGIESIVNLNILSAQDLDVYEDRIKVDFMYFNETAGVKVCNVSGIPNTARFVVTIDRIDMYNLSGLTYLNASDCP